MQRRTDAPRTRAVRGAVRETDTRQQILKRAVELFAESGYANTSIDDIAVAVGIRKASLYYHIRSKEDLLYEVYAVLAKEVLAESERLLKTAQTPEEKLRAFFRAGLRLIASRQREVTVFLGETHVLKSRSPRWREVAAQRDAHQRIFEDILNEGIAAGVFRRLPTTVAALGMLGTISWAYHWFHPRGAMSPDEIADLFADMVLNGIRRDGLPLGVQGSKEWAPKRQARIRRTK